jgi:hypothetical protein
LSLGNAVVKRGYVEDWLVREEAEAKAIESRHFRQMLWTAGIAAIAGIVAAIAGIIDAIAGIAALSLADMMDGS